MLTCPFTDLSSIAPLERLVCLPSAQRGSGGGLYVVGGGVANLDGCNVFSNEAQVRADRAGRPFPDLTSSAPLERFVCSLSACRVRGAGSSSWARQR